MHVVCFSAEYDWVPEVDSLASSLRMLTILLPKNSAKLFASSVVDGTVG